MATKITKDGYGQLELNNAAWRRDGRIEAQCKLNAEDFADMPAENGMLLAVDNVTREIKLPTTANLNAGMPVAINYSTEHMYGEEFQLKEFKLELGDFLPRLGYLSIGDKFTTNTLTFDTSLGADEEAAVDVLRDLTANVIYGGVDADTGYIKLSTTEPTEGPVLKVVQFTDMPDGQPAVKLQVLQA